MVSQHRLRELFLYEPEGRLRKIAPNRRKDYPWRATGAGGRYLTSNIDGTDQYLHRMVWLYHYGWLPDMIDHINGGTTDNRIENLRPCCNAQNQYNSKRKNNNRSGFKGVVLHKSGKTKKWQAKIVVNGVVKSLGYHETPELAHKAYVKGSQVFAKEFHNPG